MGASGPTATPRVRWTWPCCYGDEQIASASLTVPHPRLTEHAFVLVPLLELAPAVVVPGLGAAQDYLASVAEQAISRL